jgi:hypothetical protein
MSWALQLAIAVIIFAAGGAGGIKWHAGQDARAALAASDVRAADAKRQIRAIEKAAGAHVSALANINNKLGDAREKIALLSGRECLDAGTVGMLNAIGRESVPAAASEPAGTPATAATGSGIRFATERDAAGAIAVCRARYAEVSSQVDQILDIEEARHPAEAVAR